MPRYRLTIEYDGAGYAGFQAQAGLPTVQGAIETAVKGFSGQDVRIAAAGRTDSGVHATGQVVHVDLEKAWPAETVMNALNAHLVKEAVAVLDSPLLATTGTRASRRPDAATSTASSTAPAVRRWSGARSGICASRWTPTPCMKRLRRSSAITTSPPSATWPASRSRRRRRWTSPGSPASARRSIWCSRPGPFLHRQVRSMTGTLVEVGLGRWTAEDVAEALAARDRTACGPGGAVGRPLSDRRGLRLSGQRKGPPVRAGLQTVRGAEAAAGLNVWRTRRPR
jgi:tRNA pseudouridine38-40 synthase